MSFKKWSFLILTLSLVMGVGACKMDSARLADAGLGLAAAATISDADLIKESRQMRAVGDSQNKVAPSNNKYAIRLAKLIKGLQNEGGLDLNFKVYITNDINANATPDGSIRVYSGIMDLMTDDELFFILGHEIGHVKNGDAMDAMRVAYSAAAGRSGVAAAGGTVAALSDSVLGDILETVVNAQFSQSQESASDLYGYQMMLKYKRNPQAAVTALQKLDSLGSSGGMFASHPNSADRANAIAQMIKTGK